MLTIADLCERLRCSPATAYRLVKSGHLRASKNPGRNGSIRVSEEDLSEYLMTRVVAAPGDAINDDGYAA